MIKHIVFWRLNDTAKGNVSGLLKIEVGLNFNDEEDSSDVVLYLEFDSKDSLMEYQVHPDHIKIKKWLKDVRYERRVVDYELKVSI